MNTQDKIIKMKIAADLAGLSPSTIRRLVKKGKFPAPVAIPGTTRKGWSLFEISRYVEEVTKQSNAQVLVHTKTWRTAKM